MAVVAAVGRRRGAMRQVPVSISVPVSRMELLAPRMLKLERQTLRSLSRSPRPSRARGWGSSCRCRSSLTLDTLGSHADDLRLTTRARKSRRPRLLTAPAALRQLAEYTKGRSFEGPSGPPGFQEMAGRITRYPGRAAEKQNIATPPHRDITLTKRWMDALGVDVACIFPTPMLALALHPQVEAEVGLARA